MLTIVTLDRPTESSRLSEKDALELGRLVKRAVREKWEVENAIKILSGVDRIPEYGNARLGGTWWTELLDTYGRLLPVMRR